MADYTRCYVPGGSYFFTVATEQRAPILAHEPAVACLRGAFRECLRLLPFRVDALVVLPDHLHAIWTLPAEDADFSKRWGIVKKHFTQTWLALDGLKQSRSASRIPHRRRGVWQRRFWEHALRDEQDFARHLHYLHYNPVRHGLVACLRDWPHSSFHKWVERGVYELDWGCGLSASPEFGAPIDTVGE